MTRFRKEISAQKIRDTALSLFGSEGYYNTSIRQIASKANVALGLLYSHYAGKEALLRDLFQTGINSIQNEFNQRSKELSLSEQCLLTFQILTEHAPYWRLLHGIRMQKSLSDYLYQEIEDIQLYFIEHFRNELKKRKVKNPRTEARIIWTCIDGIFAEKQTRDEFPAEKTLLALAARYEP
ncbi:MAG: TetR family transcriptional regulator [Bacteroidetes bacterium]|nr:TetR family transcriptional regulator [Bacteroidota bacterium]